ncbi:MAG: phage tail sheath family protein [Sulfitobacter sp.]
MINPTYPGVYVREESSGARAVAGVATSITAFVGMTQRGPMTKPMRIFNPADYARLFGASPEGGHMSRQVQLYFDNGGGEAWVTRVAKDAVAAHITLRNEAQVDILKLEAREAGNDGSLLRTEVSYDTISPEERFTMTIYRRVLNVSGIAEAVDTETFANLSMNPGDANYAPNVINATSALAKAEAVGGPPAPAATVPSILYAGVMLNTTDATAGDTIRSRIGGPGTADFQLVYNGRPAIPVSVDIAAGETSSTIIANIATAMSQALQFDGITQTVTGASTSASGRRQLSLSMDGASFDILPGSVNDLAAALMLSRSQGAVYVDRFASFRPAPTGYVSRLHNPADDDLNRLFQFINVAKADLTHFEITDASVAGSPGEQVITYPDGTGNMMVGTAFVPTNGEVGSFSNVVENLNAIADAITADSNKRWTAEVHGVRIALTPTFGNSDTGPTTSLTTSNGPAPGAGHDLSTAARMFGATSDNVAAYSFGQAGNPGGGGVFQNRAIAEDGDNGLIPTVDEYRAAFTEIERNVDLFNLMVLPRAATQIATQSDAQRKVAFNAASSFCEKKRAFLLVDPPSIDAGDVWEDATSAESGVDTLRIGLETRNSAVFWPRLKQADGSHQDPAGPIAGLMARTDGRRGVWKAAAGVEATLRGVAGVEYPMSDPENGVINPKAVNALRVFPDGVLSWGARTLVGFNDSGNIDDKYIPVRRTMLYIEESLYRGLRFAVFEPNGEQLWSQIRLAAGSFMNGLFRQGAFAGTKASDAYYVLCDQSTTTPTDQNLGIVNVVVAFAPLKPAEFVVLTVKQIAAQAQT